MFPLSNDLRGAQKGDEQCEDLDSLHCDRKISDCLRNCERNERFV